MDHVWHTRILICCVAVAAVAGAADEALSRAPHLAAKLPDLWWLNYVPLVLLSIAGILWIARLLKDWNRPNSIPQAQSAESTAGEPPSKLKILSASYAAIDGGGDKYDVADCMRRMIRGDSLVLDIENHSFVVDGRNLVPKDPKPYAKKLLRVEYSYSNGQTVKAERPEGHRLVLPEDSYLVGSVPLQLEAVRLSMDLLEFLRRLGPPPVPKYTAQEIQTMPSAKAQKLNEEKDPDYIEACEFHFPGIMGPLDVEGNPAGMASVAYQKQIKVSSLPIFARQEKVRAELNQGDLTKRVFGLKNRLTIEGFIDEAMQLEMDTLQDEQGIKAIASTLWKLAYMIIEKGPS